LLQTHLPNQAVNKDVEAIDLLSGLEGKAVADQDTKDEDLELGTCTTCRFQLVAKRLSPHERESSSGWDGKIGLDKLAANAKNCEYCRFLLQTCERDTVFFKHVKEMGGEVGIKMKRDGTGLPRLDLDGPFREAHAVVKGPFKPMIKTKLFNSRILQLDTRREGDCAHFSGRVVGEASELWALSRVVDEVYGTSREDVHGGNDGSYRVWNEAHRRQSSAYC
jgi:hypothetical protein